MSVARVRPAVGGEPPPLRFAPAAVPPRVRAIVPARRRSLFATALDRPVVFWAGLLLGSGLGALLCRLVVSAVA